MFAKWRSLFTHYIRDALAVWLGLRDPDVPFAAKLAGVASIVYLFLPADIIPDVVPLVGWLDDFAAIPLGARLAAKFIPPGTMERLRSDADHVLYRWGPRVAAISFAAFVLWLVLAGVGAYLLWSGHNQGARIGSALPPHLRGN